MFSRIYAGMRISEFRGDMQYAGRSFRAICSMHRSMQSTFGVICSMHGSMQSTFGVICSMHRAEVHICIYARKHPSGSSLQDFVKAGRCEVTPERLKVMITHCQSPGAESVFRQSLGFH